MINYSVQRQDFIQRLDVVRGIISATHPQGTTAPISREARGMAIVLLYAAYENLLTSLFRSILETVIGLRVGNRRLRPGLKLVASHGKLQSLRSVSAAAIWRMGFDLVATLSDSRVCSIAPDVFPNDGSHFRRPQVITFCQVLGLEDPAPVLREVWQRIDTVVSERNAIAHGRITPGDVGRNYSLADTQMLVDLWQLRWCEFMDWIEASATSRDFFRLPR